MLMTDTNNGYERFVRGDGSVWYLCDYCIKVGYCAGTKEQMIKHVKENHSAPTISEAM